MIEDDLKPDKTLQRIEERISVSKPTELFINTIKAVLASTPLAGGLASLINDYIPSGRYLRLEEFSRQIAEDLKRLEEYVDTEYLKTEQFGFICEKCIRGAYENPQQDKLNAFRGIFINSLIDNDLPEEEKEFFLNIVGNLSVLHIRILRFMAYPKQYLKAAGISEDQIRGGFSQFFPVAIPGIDLEVIKSAFGDLYRLNFTRTDSKIFDTMTSGGGLDLLGGRISDVGKRFIKFCTSPE